MLGSAGDNGFGMKTARELGAVTQGVYLIVDAGIDVHFGARSQRGPRLFARCTTPTTAPRTMPSGTWGTSGTSGPTDLRLLRQRSVSGGEGSLT